MPEFTNKGWREKDKWQKIISIPLSDCINATGQMERADIFKKSAAVDPNILKFGKYKGRAKDWVSKHDPGYYAWCKDNIKGF